MLSQMSMFRNVLKGVTAVLVSFVLLWGNNGFYLFPFLNTVAKVLDGNNFGHGLLKRVPIINVDRIENKV